MSSADKGEVNTLCSKKSGKYMLRSHFGIQTDSKMKACKITSTQVHPLHTIHAPIYKVGGVIYSWSYCVTGYYICHPTLS